MGEGYCKPCIADCGTLTSPENGNIDLSNGTTYGQIAVFTCSSGYDVFGSSRLECQEDRQWSAPSPSCQITGQSIWLILVLMVNEVYFCQARLQ